MASANLELARSIYAAWERGNFSEDEWAHPEIEFVRADSPEAGRWRGLSGMAMAFREFLSAWQDVRIEATQYRELDDERVLVLVSFSGRGKTSGIELGQVWTKGASVFHIRGGKVTRLVAYADYKRALADLASAPEEVSRDSVGLAREVLDALSRREPSRLIELSDPEVEWHSFFALGEGGAYRGHEGTRRYMSDLDDAFEIGRAEVDNALGIGDVAVLVGRIHYRGKGSGVESASPAGWMLKFRDGKLLCFRAFREPEEVLGSLGSSD
jgi:ketosteroid isomerase-like protein